MHATFQHSLSGLTSLLPLSARPHRVEECSAKGGGARQRPEVQVVWHEGRRPPPLLTVLDHKMFFSGQFSSLSAFFHVLTPALQTGQSQINVQAHEASDQVASIRVLGRAWLRPDQGATQNQIRESTCLLQRFCFLYLISVSKTTFPFFLLASVLLSASYPFAFAGLYPVLTNVFVAKG